MRTSDLGSGTVIRNVVPTVRIKTLFDTKQYCEVCSVEGRADGVNEHDGDIEKCILAKDVIIESCSFM